MPSQFFGTFKENFWKNCVGMASKFPAVEYISEAGGASTVSSHGPLVKGGVCRHLFQKLFDIAPKRFYKSFADCVRIIDQHNLSGKNRIFERHGYNVRIFWNEIF